MSKKNKRKKKSRFNSDSEEGIISNIWGLSWDSLGNDEQKGKEFVSAYCKMLDILLEAVDSRRISSYDVEIFIREMESMMNSKLQKYPEIRMELKKTLKEREQKLNLFGIFVSEEEAKGMDDRHELVEKLLDARDKSRAETTAEGKKEIIFNMFAEGFNDKIISKYSSGYSVEDVAALRKEWLEKVRSEEDN